MALDQIDTFMAAIRRIESGSYEGNYTATNSKSSASGAYQFIDSTWQGMTRRYGIGTEYTRAMHAPPEVQDAVARAAMTDYFNQFGRWDAVAIAWFGGPGRVQGYLDGTLDMGGGDALGGTYSSYISKLDEYMADPQNPGGSVAVGTGPSGANLTNAGEQVALPNGYELMKHNGRTYAVYSFFDDVNDGALAFEVTPGMQVTGTPTDANFGEYVVIGGTTDVLRDIEPGQSVQDMVWEIIENRLSPNNPLVRDGILRAGREPELFSIFLQVAARPDMSEGELTQLIDNSSWGQAHSEAQKQWNSLNPEDQRQLVNDFAARITDVWLREVGEVRGVDDPLVQSFARDIASGQMTFNYFQTSVLRSFAQQNPESPFNREVRSEQEAQRQRQIDIENMQREVRAMGERWGVQMQDSTLVKFAEDIVSNVRSWQDLENHLKQQAQVLYPWKDPEMDTATAAEPWLQAYGRIMERPGSLFNQDIQKALQSGTPLFEFERELKMTDEWLNTTKNARDEIGRAAETVGQIMGFM